MRVQIWRVAALAALLFLHADSGALASAEAECETCSGSGPATECVPVGAGGSGYTGCDEHFDTHHGWHCDFTGDQCTILPA